MEKKKVVRGKGQVTYKGRPIRITPVSQLSIPLQGNMTEVSLEREVTQGTIMPN